MMKKAVLLLVLLAIVSYSVTAATVRLNSPGGNTAGLCSVPDTGGSCNFEYVFGCQETGWYYTDSPDSSYTGGGNVFNCECLAQTTQCTGGDLQTCDANFKWQTYGPAVEAGYCTDGLDNDCDGLVDCQDPECAGSISGNVKNTDSQNIEDATVDIIQGTSSKYQDFTNTLGNYQTDNVLCGNYNMVASANGYVSSSQTNINIPPQTPLTVNFDGNNALVSGSICESDCTYTGDETIHKECSGINGCAFYDVQAALVCDLAQPGWIRDYNAAQQIECAGGTPYEQAEVAATVTCAKENLIETTKVVNYLGKLVKMVVVMCG